MQKNKTLIEDRKLKREQYRGKIIDLVLEEKPVNYKIISSKGEENSNKETCGEILSFNEKGILLLTEEDIKEGSYINLSIKFKELGPLDDILGKVKKVERSEENDFYVGIELYSQEQIRAEALSSLFPEQAAGFEQKLKKRLIEYFDQEKEHQDKLDTALT
ncbi:MAG: hypothetical protein OEV55_06050 [candidate division Zixibacteria bacterium]|nr:hypothetical protein [candidate division Zixibacteria bacterium]